MDYEAIPLSENLTSLPAALKKLDNAYALRNNQHRCSATTSEIKTTISDHKKKYLDLVKEKRIVPATIESQYKESFNIKDLALQNKNLTTLLLAWPDYINPEIITSINCSHNNLEDFPLSLLAKTMPNLTNLNLDHNNISYIATHGKSSLNKLSHLTLSNNQLTEIDYEGIMRICPAIKMINLSNNPLTSLLLNDESNCCMLNEDFAIDARNTQLSPENILLLKKYCLMSIHNSMKNKLYAEAFTGTCIGSAGLGSLFTLLSLLFVQHFSPIAALAGIPCAAGLSGMAFFFKKQVAERQTFHNIRSDYEDPIVDNDSTIIE